MNFKLSLLILCLFSRVCLATDRSIYSSKFKVSHMLFAPHIFASNIYSLGILYIPVKWSFVFELPKRICNFCLNLCCRKLYQDSEKNNGYQICRSQYFLQNLFHTF